ncbi:hypothetical protein GCM10011396_29120 [Undibacterium terreum]|uniref:chorismate mutase n=1 Tax=Undibacterium terreum TaxID=1224302 RepID=A0A916UNV8_9BURK|nr:hypothetical protein GCM10011396_29120 [Undibacterium terreum]
MAVAPLVAKSKWNSGAPVDDPAREQQILDDIGSRAKQAGLDAKLAKDFFQSQFDAGKIIQLQLHAKWRQQHLPNFDNAPDLGRDVRPVLDKLTPELIAALNELQTHLCDADIQRLLVQQSMQVFTAEWDQPTRERALAPLLCTKNA